MCTGVALLLLACGGHDDNAAAPASIFAQPVDTSVVAGRAAVFSVTASGAAAYQWQISVDGGVLWADIAGATSATLTADAAAADGTRYRVVVTGRNGAKVTSSTVTLTVTAAVVAPAITMQPAAQTVIEGQDASFSITATGTALAYQWQVTSDGGNSYSNLAGATGATLTLSAVVLADNDKRFRVNVSNSAGVVASNGALLVVRPMPAAPAFSAQPVDVAVTAPMPASFTAVVTGLPTPSLQWQISANGAATFVDIASATGPSFSIAATTVATSGARYRLVAGNSVATTISNIATLTVAAMPVAPGFSLQPANASVATPTAATFTVTTTGTPSPALQWQLSVDAGATFTNINGATGASFTTAPTTLADSGKKFRAVATNSVSSVASTAATLTVLPAASSGLALLAGAIGGYGNADGTGSGARFSSPIASAVDSAGNAYVVDSENHTIRKVTPAGAVTTFAGTAGSSGSADGTGAAARFFYPAGIAIDSAGNAYVADWGNRTIRKITASGAVTTLAGTAGGTGSVDGPGGSASFGGPRGVAVDGAGTVYVADTDGSTVRKITPAGVVSTLAGLAGTTGNVDGAGAAALFRFPRALAVNAAGTVYVADTYNNVLRAITPAGVVSTLAGSTQGSADGVGSAAQFSSPSSVAVDAAGTLYIADTDFSLVRKVTPAGAVTTLAGSPGTADSVDGSGAVAHFNRPWGIAVDAAGVLFVSDTGNHTLRKVSPAGVVGTLAGLASRSGRTDGAGAAARFFAPNGLAVDATGNTYVAEANHLIRKISPAGVVTTLAGSSNGSADGNGNAASFAYPTALAVDAAGNVYVADTSNHIIRKITPAGDVSTLAGMAGVQGSADGTGTAAQFTQPSGIAVDASGNVFVADSGNQTIRKISPAGVVSTVAGTAGSSGGSDGPAATALFAFPTGIAFDATGNLVIADPNGGTIRRLSAGGTVTTIAGTFNTQGSADGTGAAARFLYPFALALDAAGNVYIADSENSTVRKLTPAGVVTTVVGVAGEKVVRLGSNPRLNSPHGIAVLDANHLAISSLAENAVLIATVP